MVGEIFYLSEAKDKSLHYCLQSKYRKPDERQCSEMRVWAKILKLSDGGKYITDKSSEMTNKAKQIRKYTVSIKLLIIIKFAIFDKLINCTSVWLGIKKRFKL